MIYKSIELLHEQQLLDIDCLIEAHEIGACDSRCVLCESEAEVKAEKERDHLVFLKQGHSYHLRNHRHLEEYPLVNSCLYCREEFFILAILRTEEVH